MLGYFDYDGPDLSELTVATELLSASDIGEAKPKIMGVLMCCTQYLIIEPKNLVSTNFPTHIIFLFLDSPVPCESVRVTTYSHNRHFGGYFDHDALVSTEVMKAKFRIADDVLDHLCLDYEKQW